MKPEKNDRFVCSSYTSTGLGSRCEVLVDRHTGVNYLFAASGNAGGLTVLVDAQGKPVVTPISRDENA